MRHLLFALLACIITLPSVAKIKPTVKDFADTIAIKYTQGQILVPITINGKTYDFIFDTGANASVIPDSLKDQLFVKTKSTKKVKNFNNNASKVSMGVLAEMTIGKTHLNGARCATANNDQFVLGAYELQLSNISAKIDLKQGVIILTDRKDFFKDDLGYKLPEKTFGFMTQLQFSLSQGCNGNALFDTGNNMFFNLSQKYFAKSVNGENGDEFLKQVVWTDTTTYAGFDGAPVSSVQTLLKMNEVKFGDLTFCNVPTRTTPNYTGFGCRMLEYGSVIMDAKHWMTYFKPFTEGTTVEIKAEVPQVRLIVGENEQISVGSVDTKREAFAAGVRVGDRLVELNGKPSSNIQEMGQTISQMERADFTKPFTAKFRNAAGRDINVTFGPQRNGFFFDL